MYSLEPNKFLHSPKKTKEPVKATEEMIQIKHDLVKQYIIMVSMEIKPGLN